MNIRVVFIIYKFRLVWKNRKNVRSNDLGLARLNIGPGRLQTDCATHESDPGQGSGAAPHSRWTGKPAAGSR
jgi:hypothetical protein